MSEFIIRPAEPRDLEAVNTLLRQVLAVHHAARPDLFRPEGKKYSDEEILAIFDNPMPLAMAQNFPMISLSPMKS